MGRHLPSFHLRQGVRLRVPCRKQGPFDLKMVNVGKGTTK